MADSGLYDSDSEISSIADDIDTIADESEAEQESLSGTETAAASDPVQRHPPEDSSGQDQILAQTAKALDMAEEGTDGSAEETRAPAHQAAAERSSASAWADEQTPLLDAGPPPPNYTAATAGRNVASNREQAPSVLSSQIVSDHAQRNASSAEDQSMSEETIRAGDYVTYPSTWAKMTEKERRRIFKRRLIVCLLLVFFAAICITVAVAVGVTQNRKHNTTYTPDEDAPWNNLYYPQRYHVNNSRCRFDSYSALNSIWFEHLDPDSPDQGDFRFIETMKTSDHPDFPDFPDAMISGRLEIRPAPYDQVEPVDVWMNAAATAPWKAEMPEFVDVKNGLKVRFPRMAKQSAYDNALDVEQTVAKDTKPCYDLWVRIYVKAPMENWQIHTTNMDIFLGPGYSHDRERQPWDFQVRKSIDLSAVRGAIITYPEDTWHSGDMSMETVWGSIRGEFAMENTVNLTTQSGTISGNVILGKSLDDELYPKHNGSSKLTTVTESGTTSLSVQPYWSDSGQPIESYHSSRSGQMMLNYGAKENWQGEIDVETVSGSVQVRGKDVKVLPNDEIGQEVARVRAKQGKGDSRIKVETVSGDVEVMMRDVDRWS